MEKVIRILGSGGALPMNGKGASSELIYLNNDDFVLFDAGFGTAQALSVSGHGLANLNAIFIGHYHTDHVCDLPTVLFSYFMQTEHKSITIYIPNERREFIQNLFFEVYGHLADILKMVKGFRPRLDLVPFMNDSVEIKGARIRSLQMEHGGCEAYGLTIQQNDYRIAISGDCTYSPALVELASNADILIQDCAFSDDFGPNPIHAVPSQIVKLINEAACRRVYLNHLMPETKGKEKTIVESINSKVNAVVELANDGQDIYR